MQSFCAATLEERSCAAAQLRGVAGLLLGCSVMHRDQFAFKTIFRQQDP
jgi:hypothetical protein